MYTVLREGETDCENRFRRNSLLSQTLFTVTVKRYACKVIALTHETTVVCFV